MKKLVILYSLCLMALSCHDNDSNPTTLTTCTLSTSPTVDKVTYDANGRVTSLITAVANGTATAQVLSSFTYDAAGKLTKTVYTINGALNSQESYTYTGDRLSQTKFSGPNSPTGVNSLSFDAAGRLTRYTVEENGQLQYAQTYAYNQNGVLTEEAVVDDQGNTLFKVITKPIGTVKSPDKLLVKGGLPYLIPLGTPLAEAEGNVGTVKEYYGPGNDGKLVLQGSQKITALKINATGYFTELTYADLDGKNPNTLTYTLSNCP